MINLNLLYCFKYKHVIKKIRITDTFLFMDMEAKTLNVYFHADNIVSFF